MNREEAVKRFKGIRESFSISIAQSKFYPSKVILNELCDMAIEALSQPIVCKDFLIDDDHIYCSPKVADRVVKALSAKPNCKECIRHNNTTFFMDGEDETDGDEDYEHATLVDIKEPLKKTHADGDLISRQWLLDLYGDYIGDNGEPKYHVPLEVVRQNIKDAPSAEAVQGFRGGKIPPKEMLNGTVLIPQHQWLEMERELANLKQEFESADRPTNTPTNTPTDHDNEWIIGCIQHDGFIHTHRFDKANRIILEALQTDVVRCKDCRHAYYADNRVPHEKTWVCEQFVNEEITSNDFCSWGERKGGEDE